MFTFVVKDGTLSVKHLLNLIPSVALSVIKLPDRLPDILNLHTKEFGIDMCSDQIFVEITVSKTLSYFGNSILSHCATGGQFTNKQSEATSQWRNIIQQCSFLCLIADHQNTYFLNAHAEEFSILSIISTFLRKS